MGCQYATTEATLLPNDHPERRHRPPTEAEEQSATKRATGREPEEWFGLLDEWGAAERTSGEITTWLARRHGISAWWAQKLTITYEQARGRREPGARADGTYAATASKTVHASAQRAFEAIVHPEYRDRWLPDLPLRLRASRPDRSVRFDGEQETLVVFDIQSAGESRCVVAVEHQRLSSSADSQRYKAYWRERLTALRDQLAAEPTD